MTTMSRVGSLLIGFLLYSTVALAQTLSPGAQVSLLTFGPGDDLYSVFGHTAIRISDPAQRLDKVYNYGEFDFRTDNFYIKFLRGTLPYQIGAADMYSTLYTYQSDNRSIREQVLALSPTAKNRLFQALETNLLPQNRQYSYRFFYDNCATRPRDMLVEAAADSLQLPTAQLRTGKSYRNWMNEYLSAKPWAKLGMNLAIGYPADAATDGWKAMYLPDNVYNQLARAVLVQPDGEKKPLVSETRTLSDPPKLFRKQLPFLLSPEFVFGILGLVVIIITLLQYKIGVVSRRVDRLLFGFAGLCGWFLLLLWVGTDHGVTAWNPTLLYLAPYHLPLIFWATGRNVPARRRTMYFGLTAALVLVGIFLSKVPGGVDVLFPLTLLVRCLINMQLARQKQLAIREM